MTREKAIKILSQHSEHWKRLLTENICSKEEGLQTVEALDMAIKALQQNESAEEWYKLFVEKLEQEPKYRDCVSRDYLLSIANKDGAYGYVSAHEIINAPSVNPQKTGHWILDETDNSITCNKCGCLIWANDISNGEAYYCPNCGFRMVEQKESEG